MMTPEQHAALEGLYRGEIPGYLEINSIDEIVIAAEVWEGSGAQKYTITPSDVVHYYRQDNPLGCNGMSGCRTIDGFTTDWRMVDRMARESLDIFKILNREAIETEAARYGMRLRE